MRDDAQQVHYFNNTVVAPTGKYEYDPLYRLLKAEGRELSSLNAPDSNDFANNIPVPSDSSMQNYVHQYSFDQLGNIQTLQSTGGNGWTRTYNYNNTANNYLSSTQVGQDVFSYTYDVHGNMTSMPHLSSMQWDFADRLRRVQLNLSGDTAYYIYDSTGNRCRKVVEKGSVREERYYVDGYEVFRKFISGDLDFERQSLHISDDEKKFSSIETKTWENGELIVNPVPAIRYQYDNHLGSACLELDETASIISYEEYHPFGTTSYRSGRTETEVSLKRYKYVGKERDEETGLYYYGARYYAAWLCRFVSVDPLQHKYPELTSFQYASNRPVTYIDLDGLEIEASEEEPCESFEEYQKEIMEECLEPSRTIEPNIIVTPEENLRIYEELENPETTEEIIANINKAAKPSYTGIDPMFDNLIGHVANWRQWETVITDNLISQNPNSTTISQVRIGFTDSNGNYRICVLDNLTLTEKGWTYTEAKWSDTFSFSETNIGTRMTRNQNPLTEVLAKNGFIEVSLLNRQETLNKNTFGSEEIKTGTTITITDIMVVTYTGNPIMQQDATDVVSPKIQQFEVNH